MGRLSELQNELRNENKNKATIGRSTSDGTTNSIITQLQNELKGIKSTYVPVTNFNTDEILRKDITKHIQVQDEETIYKSIVEKGKQSKDNPFNKIGTYKEYMPNILGGLTGEYRFV